MKPSKAADLLKILGEKAPTAAPKAEPKAEPKPAPAIGSTAPDSPNPRPKRAAQSQKPAAIRGRGVHIWLHEEDEKLIRELSVWLHAQRPRINDSLVIKAVLRAAKTGSALLAAYDEAVKIDGRKK